MLNFGEVFSRAWNIIWKNKVLWIFGLLAGLAASGDSGSGLQFDYRSHLQQPWADRIMGNIPAWLILFLILAGIVVFVLVVVLSTLGRAGLMRGAWLADRGEGALTFGNLFQDSQRYFLRVLLIEILMIGVGLTLVLILLFPTVMTLGLALLCLWPLFCLLVPAFLGLSVLSKLAIAAIAGEDLSMMDGLRRAWEVMRANLLQVAAVAFVLILGGYIVSAIIAMPAMLMLVPMAIGFTSAASSGWMQGGAILSALLFVIYLPVLLIANGVLTAYIDTTWALVFRRLTGRGAGATSEAEVIEA